MTLAAREAVLARVCRDYEPIVVATELDVMAQLKLQVKRGQLVNACKTVSPLWAWCERIEQQEDGKIEVMARGYVAMRNLQFE